MNKQVSYLIQGKNIIVVFDGRSHTISKDTHPSYTKIIEALKAESWDELRDLVEPAKSVIKFGQGNVTIDGDAVFWKGQPMHNSLTNRMIDMLEEGFPIEPMVNFMENLMGNPSKRSVDQLYGFLEQNSLPITEDGYFLAFKKVREDYLDIHSATIFNGVGTVVEMERNMVDDNPDSHCSIGLHFCSISYLAQFGGRDDPVMILKINPADVVSIPSDCNGAKGRCMRYEVVAEVNGDPANSFSSIVSKEYTKVATPKSLLDDAQWPFSQMPIDPPVEDAVWPFDVDGTHPDDRLDDNDLRDEDLFDVVRVYGGLVEATGLTRDEADEMVEKNARQKKAMLKVVNYGD